MSNEVELPFLRVFAGPNGSGKSTIKSKFNQHELGVYLNPDEVQKKIDETHQLNFLDFGVEVDFDSFINFSNTHTLLKKIGTEELLRLTSQDNFVIFPNNYSLYLIPLITDFIRHCLIENNISFTFETVMSSVDKIEFLKKAKTLDYKIYLYFVATEDPLINVERVARRVQLGGHNVPTEKIISRYYQALENLTKAIQWCNRVFLIDNSGLSANVVAEILNGSKIVVPKLTVPLWVYKYVCEPLSLYPVVSDDSIS